MRAMAFGITCHDSQQDKINIAQSIDTFVVSAMRRIPKISPNKSHYQSTQHGSRASNEKNIKTQSMSEELY
jgi:hypothetical protein